MLAFLQMRGFIKISSDTCSMFLPLALSLLNLLACSLMVSFCTSSAALGPESRLKDCVAVFRVSKPQPMAQNKKMTTLKWKNGLQ